MHVSVCTYLSHLPRYVDSPKSVWYEENVFVSTKEARAFLSLSFRLYTVTSCMD
jgi:hypothetical protein